MSRVTRKQYSLAIYHRFVRIEEESDFAGNTIRHHFDAEGREIGFNVNYREFFLLESE
jgi:hypothetical protein